MAAMQPAVFGKVRIKGFFYPREFPLNNITIHLSLPNFPFVNPSSISLFK